MAVGLALYCAASIFVAVGAQEAPQQAKQWLHDAVKEGDEPIVRNALAKGRPELVNTADTCAHPQPGRVPLASYGGACLIAPFRCLLLQTASPQYFSRGTVASQKRCWKQALIPPSAKTAVRPTSRALRCCLHCGFVAS